MGCWNSGSEEGGGNCEKTAALVSASAVADTGIVRQVAVLLVAQAAGVRHDNGRGQRGQYPRQHCQHHALRNQPLHYPRKASIHR